jgi:hypothetical protein
VVTRGVSTALDALLFLLLVSAAATTLALPAGPTTGPDADPAATVVSRSTASVDYRLTPRADDETFPRRDIGVERHARGRLAALLARAATRNATVDGQPITHTGDGLERAVATAVANATAPRTHVVAVWRPYESAAIAGRVTAGQPPPRDASVASRTLTVPTNAAGTREAALAAANRSGYEGVARVVADLTLAVLVPRDGMTGALAADYPTDRIAARRHHRLAALLGTDVSTAVDRGNASAANARLRTALVDRLEPTLRDRFASPTAAARAVQGGRVRIVVRRWSV